MDDTKSRAYTVRLMRRQSALWKRLLHVQAPYRWNLKRLRPGRALDLGCGVGRNLAWLSPDSVGIDHSEAAVAACRSRGLKAYTPAQFRIEAGIGCFDSLLCAHVLEHMTLQAAVDCIAQYVPYLKPDSRIIVMSPQERGFASDSTHVEFMPPEKLARILERHGFAVARTYSFPLPRWAGRYFPYNEFIVVGERTAAAALLEAQRLHRV